ncbi:MAG: 6-phosphogluconolactonase [Phyllobacteriaceae bacterium]|nr:6-phosphogluconolactonase [Phyllobacteriaceae bacterium]
MNAIFNIHGSRADLADRLAADVAARLAEAIAAKGRASLAVSGGQTPAAFFHALSRQPLDWEKLDVTLVDERFVPETSERSNARLVKAKLLTGEAAKARFFPLWRADRSVEAAAFHADGEVYALVRKLDVVVLGMGTDGHVASYFPDAENYQKLFLACDAVMAVRAANAGEARLTVSPRLVANASHIYLHFEGAEKKALFDAALADAGPHRLPVATVVGLAKTPVAVHWAA